MRYFCVKCGKKIKGRFRSLLCEQCRIAKFYQQQKNAKEKENSKKISQENGKKEKEIKNMIVNQEKTDPFEEETEEVNEPEEPETETEEETE